MSSPRASLIHPRRFLAAAVLVMFAAAQTLCFEHCLFGDPQGTCDGRSSCHAPARSDGDSPIDATPAPEQGATCSNLRTMLASAEAPPLLAPPCILPELPHPVTPLPDPAASGQILSLPHPTHPPDWAATPVVRLGPAFRSLAPPLVG